MSTVVREGVLRPAFLQCSSSIICQSRAACSLSSREFVYLRNEPFRLVLNPVIESTWLASRPDTFGV